MKWSVFVILVLNGQVEAQNKDFAFYADNFELPGYSPIEKDSLLNQDGVPYRIKSYLDNKIREINLADWGLIYFLDAFVDAQFGQESDFNKVKIINKILTGERLNYAVGIASKNRILTLVSVDNKAKLINIQYAKQDGYKFLSIKKNQAIPKLRNLNLYVRAEYKDIAVDYTRVPNFRNLVPKQKKAYFFNYYLQSTDSLIFKFSKSYNDYFNDLPRIIPNYEYYKAPVSPIFKESLFQEIDKKVKFCNTKIDSINFLIKFIQTAVQFEEDIVLYGKVDFCSFPENTIAIGKGDCEDKCEAFAFLIDHYFPDIDIVFLFYPHHVAIGLGNSNLPAIGKPYQEFEGKRYLEVELQANQTVLADESFALFHEVPTSISK